MENLGFERVLLDSGPTREESGQTIQGVDSTADAEVIHVVTEDATFDVAYMRWRNGERDIRCLRGDGPRWAHRLENRHRLGIYRSRRGDFTELSATQLDDETGWSRRFKPSKDDLDEIYDGDAFELLRRSGAISINTRARLFGDDGQRASYLAALFPPDHVQGPVAAFILTRILPLQAEASGR